MSHYDVTLRRAATLEPMQRSAGREVRGPYKVGRPGRKAPAPLVRRCLAADCPPNPQQPLKRHPRIAHCCRTNCPTQPASQSTNPHPLYPPKLTRLSCSVFMKRKRSTGKNLSHHCKGASTIPSGTNLLKGNGGVQGLSPWASYRRFGAWQTFSRTWGDELGGGGGFGGGWAWGLWGTRRGNDERGEVRGREVGRGEWLAGGGGGGVG